MPDQLRTIAGWLDDAHFDGIHGGSIKLRSYKGAREVEIIGGGVLDHDGVRRLMHALSLVLNPERPVVDEHERHPHTLTGECVDG